VIGSGWRGAPRRLALVAAAALIPVLAGCEAGNSAPTLAFHFPTDAAGATVGDLGINNVFVLGAPLGRSLAPGQSASVFLSLVNLHGAPDTLMSISAPGTAASVVLPASTPVVFGHPVFFTGPRPQVVLTNLTRTITSGSSIRLVLHFQKAGPISLLVPVFARAAHYVTYAPPQPTVTATVSVAVHQAGRRHAHASPSPNPSTASPNPSPTATP
jgi:hypothetical protein